MNFWKISKNETTQNIINILFKFQDWVVKNPPKADVVIQLTSIDKLRSNEQNKWWWKVCITDRVMPNLQEQLDILRLIEGKERLILDKKSAHHRIIYGDVYDIWNSDWDEWITNIDGTKTLVRSTSSLTTKQFSELMERAVKWFGENWHVYLELPDMRSFEQHLRG